MKIAIDVDGVLIDMCYYQLENGSKFFWDKYKIGISNPMGYEISDIFLVDQEKDLDFWLNHIFDYGVNYPARLFAKEIIKQLKNDGHEIVIMTARGGTEENTLPKDEMQELVKNWLKKNDIYYDEIMFTEEDKLSYCLDNQIDLIIEDKPRNISMISTTIPVICYDALYNQNITGKNIHRVYTWQDIYIKIINLQKKQK